MATKNTVTEATVSTDTEKMVTIKLPLSRPKQADVFVGINGRTWMIQRGKEVEVPECVAEVLKNSETMDSLAIERTQAIADE